MRFEQNGKNVITVPGTLKTNDDRVTQDAVVTEATGADTLPRSKRSISLIKKRR